MIYISRLDTLGLDINQSCDWLHDRTILLGIVGSQAYGTATEESDIDYKGVCVPPKEYFLGLQSFNDYNTTGGKKWKSTKNTKDFSIEHVNKFVLECMRGVPNNLELLFLKPELYVLMTPWGKELVDVREMFITKALKHKFKGYAYAQKELLVNKKANGTGRQDLIEKFGYDTKFASHAVRLLSKAVNTLETGKFETMCGNAAHLKNIRMGHYTMEQVIKEMDDLNARLESLYEHSDLIPRAPDFNKINAWLIDFNYRALKANQLIYPEDWKYKLTDAIGKIASNIRRKSNGRS